MIGIDPDKPILPHIDQKKADGRQNANNDEFKAIFQQSVGSAATESKTIESTPYISEIRPVQFESQAELPASKVVDQVGRLIKTMEAYQRQLLSRENTLRELEPAINKIAEQGQALSAILKDVEIEDDLKTIVDQSLSLSVKEVAMFKSGYYSEG